MKISSFVKVVSLSWFTLILTGCQETNQQPGCTIIFPLENSNLYLGKNLWVSIDAWDSDGSVSTIELFLNQTSISILHASPYTFTYKLADLEPGNYTLKAEAVDDQGLTKSDEIGITIHTELENFTDPRDGADYYYTTIGNQTWMSENLAYLPEIHPASDSSGNQARYYVYNYNGTDLAEARNEDSYLSAGVLYNFNAAQDACPAGWHLPGKDEWDELLNHIASEQQEVIGIQEERGMIWGSIGKYLRGTYGWNPGNANGLDPYGFSAIPTGAVSFGINYLFCVPCMGDNENMAGWWTSTAVNSYAYAFDTFTGFGDVHEAARKNDHRKEFGLSVRCVKDQ